MPSRITVRIGRTAFIPVEGGSSVRLAHIDGGDVAYRHVPNAIESPTAFDGEDDPVVLTSPTWIETTGAEDAILEYEDVTPGVLRGEIVDDEGAALPGTKAVVVTDSSGDYDTTAVLEAGATYEPPGD